MILLVVNYSGELDQKLFGKYDFVDIVYLNQNKGYFFSQIVLKKILENKNKYDLVLHFGTCGGKSEKDIGNIYKIDRTFLYHNDCIIENQRYKNGGYCFQTIHNGNIVTKFSIGQHGDKLYDFADIYDLESFWIACISNVLSIPIFTIKGVTDKNDIINTFDEVSEIEFLLNPQQKRQRKEINFEKIKKNIEFINNNFALFFEKELIDFYKKFTNDKEFRKIFI